jgi:dienelactone hydrolase
MRSLPFAFALLLVLASGTARAQRPEVIYFQNETKSLGGELFKPDGDGPFPAILYNHGSAPGMLNSEASKAIGPLFVAKGWVFFMPYRRGQGLSADAGRFIGDDIADARTHGGFKDGAATMSRLLSTEQLEDQLTALQWLRAQKFIKPNQVAVAGNSFGGVEAVLGAAQEYYCAAVDASGGAESWNSAPELQTLMKEAVRMSKSPIFFFQAENDFDLTPTKVLLAEMKMAGKDGVAKIYPPYGHSARDGHSFAYRGAGTWFDNVFEFVQQHCGQ